MTATSHGAGARPARPTAWRWVAGGLAVVFGLATLVEGGHVLFGGPQARAQAGAVVPFVLTFNAVAAFASLAAGAATLAGRAWAVWLARAVAASTLLVFAAFGVHVLQGGAFEARTAVAMTVRTLFWAAQSLALPALLPPRRPSMTVRALPQGLVVDPPARVPLLLRPALALARRLTGQDPLPGRLLAHFPKGAVGAGLFELTAAGASDLDGADGARVLAVARIVASLVAGCPFCVDMNAATWSRAGLTPAELAALLDRDAAAIARFDARSAVAARYAAALSATPVTLDPALVGDLRRAFCGREVVVLASTVAQVNFWSRFNQGLGVPAAGFFDETSCRVPPG